jgi:flagellar hook-length control protein FliK
MEIVEKSNQNGNWPRANGKTATLLKFAKGGKQLPGFNLDSSREPQKPGRTFGKAVSIMREEPQDVLHVSRHKWNAQSKDADKPSLGSGFELFGSFFDQLEKAAEQASEKASHILEEQEMQPPSATPIPEWIAFAREGSSLAPTAANTINIIDVHVEQPKSAPAAEMQQAEQTLALALDVYPARTPQAKPLGDTVTASPVRPEPAQDHKSPKPVSSAIMDSEQDRPPAGTSSETKVETQQPSMAELRVTSVPRGDMPAPQTAAQWQPPHAQIATEIVEHVTMLQESALQTEITPTLAKSFGNTFRMTLQPGEDLGDLRITLARRGKQLDVRIVAEKPETHRLLNDDVQRCLFALNELGLDTSQVSVQFGQDAAMSVDRNANEGTGTGPSASRDQHAEHNQRRDRALVESSGEAKTREHGAVSVDSRVLRRDGAIYV